MVDVSVDLLRIHSFAAAFGEDRSRSVTDRTACWKTVATPVLGGELFGDGRTDPPVGFRAEAGVESAKRDQQHADSFFALLSEVHGVSGRERGRVRMDLSVFAGRRQYE